MNLNRRNYPPDHGIRIPYDDLEKLIFQLFEKVGMSSEDANLLATILTRNNQRCIYSHGTGQIPHYIDVIKSGDVNPRPKVTTVNEAPGALVLDGDGGLGYFPCYQGTLRIIEKAKVCGVAALTTRNHHHYGSAGNYTRLAIEHDCIAISMSGHRTHLNPENSIGSIIDSSPISIAIPAGDQPPVVMDMGGGLMPYKEDVYQQLPRSVFKAMALSAAIRSLGAVFPGIYIESNRSTQWKPNQGAFIIVVNVAHFMPLDELKCEMDQFIGAARRMKPLPHMERSELAGGNEWHWERENIEKGIPMGDDHCAMLQVEADRLGVETPFERHEGTRF